MEDNEQSEIMEEMAKALEAALAAYMNDEMLDTGGIAKLLSRYDEFVRLTRSGF